MSAGGSASISYGDLRSIAGAAGDDAMMLRGSPLTMLARTAQRLRQVLAQAAALLADAPANSYRPEAHYMRGPGPKWREKHARPKG